jgi:RHH-type proline utilization regulon transcriptional repressor/proline dehydrogenase/delta 1-pyrroline-5-carboxylate dehydrogenase
LLEGDRNSLISVSRRIANLSGPLVLTQAASSADVAGMDDPYCLNWLLEEVSVSVNTAAAGGNASLMAIG